MRADIEAYPLLPRKLTSIAGSEISAKRQKRTSVHYLIANRKTASAAVSPKSAAHTSQPCELSRVVNKEQITRVVKIFSYKLTGSKLKLEFVVAGHVGSERLAVAYFERHFTVATKAHSEID